MNKHAFPCWFAAALLVCVSKLVAAPVFIAPDPISPIHQPDINVPVYALITEVDGEAGTITVAGEYRELGLADTRFRIFAPPGTETRGPLAGTLQDYQVSALSSRCLYGGYRTESPLAGRLQYFMPNPPSQTEAAFSDASAAYTSQFNTWRTSNSFGAAPVPPDINDYVIRRQGKLNFVGLQYTLHRHYDPFLMRFTSPDPIAADFKNLNAYVGNNPNRFFDPDGLQAEEKSWYQKAWNTLAAAGNGIVAACGRGGAPIVEVAVDYHKRTNDPNSLHYQHDDFKRLIHTSRMMTIEMSGVGDAARVGLNYDLRTTSTFGTDEDRAVLGTQMVLTMGFGLALGGGGPMGSMAGRMTRSMGTRTLILAESVGTKTVATSRTILNTVVRDFEIGFGATRQARRGTLSLFGGDPVPEVGFYNGGKTTGVLTTAAGETKLISGYSGPSAIMPRGTPGMNYHIRSHVEAHAAALMRQNGSSVGVLQINRVPCGGANGCAAMLPRMLPKGARLRVVGPNGYDHVFVGEVR